MLVELEMLEEVVQPIRGYKTTSKGLMMLELFNKVKENKTKDKSVLLGEEHTLIKKV